MSISSVVELESEKIIGFSHRQFVTAGAVRN